MTNAILVFLSYLCEKLCNAHTFHCLYARFSSQKAAGIVNGQGKDKTRLDKKLDTGVARRQKVQRVFAICRPSPHLKTAIFAATLSTNLYFPARISTIV